jgi:phosphate uptake regulator
MTMTTRPNKLQQRINAVHDALNEVDREVTELQRDYLTAMSRVGRRAALLKLTQLARALRPAVKAAQREEG